MFLINPYWFVDTGGSGAAITYEGTDARASNATFTTQIGTANTDRLVIFLVKTLSTSGPVEVLTVNGTSATLIEAASKVGGNFTNISMFIKKIPSGTTATVTTDETANLETAISTYSVNCSESEAAAALAFTSDFDEGANALSVNLTASPDSFLIAGRIAGNGTEQSITGVATQDYSDDIRSNEWAVAGSTTSGVSGSVTVSLTDSITNHMLFAAVASLTAP